MAATGRRWGACMPAPMVNAYRPLIHWYNALLQLQCNHNMGCRDRVQDTCRHTPTHTRGESVTMLPYVAISHLASLSQKLSSFHSFISRSCMLELSIVHLFVHPSTRQISNVQISPDQFSSAQFNSIQLSSARISSVQLKSVQFGSVQFGSPAQSRGHLRRE